MSGRPPGRGAWTLLARNRQIMDGRGDLFSLFFAKRVIDAQLMAISLNFLFLVEGRARLEEFMGSFDEIRPFLGLKFWIKA